MFLTNHTCCENLVQYFFIVHRKAAHLRLLDLSHLNAISLTTLHVLQAVELPQKVPQEQNMAQDSKFISANSKVDLWSCVTVSLC